MKLMICFFTAVVGFSNFFYNCFFAGWDVSFSKDLSSSDLLKCDCKLTIDELVKGFFSFYGFTINIASVHCPLIGDMIAKSNFLNSEFYNKISTDSYGNPFNVTTALCLQDPLECNKNLTENLIQIDGHKFKWMCRNMVDILSNAEDVKED